MDSFKFILPKNLRILEGLGQHIKLARLRRKMSTEQLAERAGIGRMTLYKIEKGSPVVSMGNYMQVLFILGLEKDLMLIGADDPLGRKIQDAKLLVKQRSPKLKKKKEDGNGE
jgi:transcriptional regulator with XRE-family HTH domain